jgi:hypothetical protein
MIPQILLPYQNPLKFHKINPDLIPQYVSKHFELFPYADTIKAWETKRPYYQPWQLNDSICQQIEANYGPIAYELIDVDGRVWASGNFVQLMSSTSGDNFNVLELNLPLNTFNEGIYFLTIENILISEPLKFLANQKNTVLLEYKHHQYTGDIVWATGFAPSVRVRGTVQPESTSSKDSFFEDQLLNLTLEDSKPFEVYKFLIGGSSGIPFWFAKKLGRILGCSTLMIDGHQYTRNADKLDPLTLDNYPMRSYSIELRDTINRGSLVIENDHIIQNKTSMIVLVNGEGFGMNNGNGSEQQIEIFS